MSALDCFPKLKWNVLMIDFANDAESWLDADGDPAFGKQVEKILIWLLFGQFHG